MSNKDLLIHKGQFFSTLFDLDTVDEIEKFAKTGNGVTNQPLKTINVKTYLSTKPASINIFEHIMYLTKLDKYISPLNKTRIMKEVFKGQDDLLNIIQTSSNFEALFNFLFAYTNMTREKIDSFILESIYKLFYVQEPEYDEELRVHYLNNVLKNMHVIKLSHHLSKIAELENTNFHRQRLFDLLSICIVLAKQDTLKHPHIIKIFTRDVKNKIEYYFHLESSSKTAVELRLLYEVLETIKITHKINSNMYDQILQLLKHMSEHYLNESTIVQVFRMLAKQSEIIKSSSQHVRNTLIDEYLTFLYTMSCKQLCMLMLIVDELHILMKLDRSRNNLYKYDKFIVQGEDFSKSFKKNVFHDEDFMQLVRDNLSTTKFIVDVAFDKHQKDHECICDKTVVVNLFEDKTGDELWTTLHLTQQGLNELYRSEKFQYQTTSKAILDKEIVPYYISRTWCRYTYRDYKKSCDETINQRCSEDKSIFDNLDIKYLIQKCMDKRKAFAQVCQYKHDPEHQQEIDNTQARIDDCISKINDQNLD